MIEEAEALMHSSIETNLALKSCVVLVLLGTICAFSFGILNACTGTGELASAEYLLFMLFDSASLTLPFICFGLYSKLPLQVVQIVASLPFLLMIFFSTTFSPGAGVGGVKVLRFLFARFYFWCKVPVVKHSMEGCPADDALLGFTVLTGCLGGVAFVIFQLIRVRVGGRRTNSRYLERRASATSTVDFEALRKELDVATSAAKVPDVDVESNVNTETPSTAAVTSKQP